VWQTADEMARTSYKNQKEDRDGTGFLAIPFVVLDSLAYRDLSHTARSLLFDIARQMNGNNNGKLVACAKYLKPYGWNSNDTVTRARNELLESRLLIETRKGARPNKAAWYAVSWTALKVSSGLDIDPARFQRGAYREMEPCKLGKVVVPAAGVATSSIAPRDGASVSTAIP
jgi:hypothetical protein